MTVQQNQSTEKKKEMVNASTDYDKLRDRGFMSRTGEAFAAFLGIFDAAGGISALLSKEEINHPGPGSQTASCGTHALYKNVQDIFI